MNEMKFAGWGDPRKTFAIEGKPGLWPFIERTLGLTGSRVVPPADFETIPLPEPRIEGGFVAALRGGLREDQMSSDRRTRLQHCFGKSYRDLLRARAGQIGRAPDMVLFPHSQDEVELIVRAADQHGVKVIAFGGGTNIVGGVEVSPVVRGMAVSVSLRRMNKVLRIDETSLVATIEAGILGPELEAALNQAGYSLGHFPDSFEFSTLGGWLATRSAGMQSDRWGKIEDMVVSLTMATPVGTIRTPVVPKAATGPDLNQLIVGSEGTLGIITEATMQIHRRLGSEYRGLLVPDFETGVKLLRRCLSDDCLPSTMRLSCPDETKLGFAMKPQSSPWKQWVQRAGKVWLSLTSGIRMEEACLMILGFEGDAAQIAAKRAQVLARARELGAVDLGTSTGARWFAGKYDYPYLRDFVMERGGMADVTETAVVWADLLPVYQKVKQALRGCLAREGFPGYVGCHISHTYPSGACLYFTFAAAQEPGRELEQYLHAKRTAVEAIVESGAALSHHHAIGYEHLLWLERSLGMTGVRALRGLKAALDPNNVCNPGKLLPGPEAALDQYWPEPKLRP